VSRLKKIIPIQNFRAPKKETFMRQFTNPQSAPVYYECIAFTNVGARPPATLDQPRSGTMAKAKSPGSTKTTAKPKPKTQMKSRDKLLQMPESGNGSGLHSPADLEVEIRLRAYALYQQRGCAPGRQEQDWFSAEQEVRARHDHHTHTA
jgi:hypothetical protein